MMAMDEMSFVVTTLERINTKLDKHDDKIDMIVTTLSQLVKVDTENKENRESIIRLFKRLEVVEHNQNTDGCQAHKAFVAVRNEQLKQFEALAKSCQENHDELEQRIEELEQKPIKAMAKVWMGVLGAIGAGIGGWVLIKFGVKQ